MTTRPAPSLFDPLPAVTVSAPPRMMAWAMSLALLFLAAAVAYVLYLASVPVLVLYVTVHPMPVTTPLVEPGGSVTYVLDYCKFVDTSAGVIRELRRVDNQITVSLAESGSSLPTGCHQIKVIEPIPSYVPDGDYVLRLTRQYRRTTYRDLPLMLETEPFTVRQRGVQ